MPTAPENALRVSVIGAEDDLLKCEVEQGVRFERRSFRDLGRLRKRERIGAFLHGERIEREAQEGEHPHQGDDDQQRRATVTRRRLTVMTRAKFVSCLHGGPFAFRDLPRPVRLPGGVCLMR